MSVTLNAPNASGVYAIYNQNRYVYFGESNDIQRRLLEHLNDRQHAMHVHGAVSFAFDLVATEAGRKARQNQLIAGCPTPCNQMFG